MSTRSSIKAGFFLLFSCVPIFFSQQVFLNSPRRFPPIAQFSLEDPASGICHHLDFPSNDFSWVPSVFSRQTTSPPSAHLNIFFTSTSIVFPRCFFFHQFPPCKVHGEFASPPPSRTARPFLVPKLSPSWRHGLSPLTFPPPPPNFAPFASHPAPTLISFC